MSYGLVRSKIRFIHVEVIPIKIFETALNLCSNIDPEDTEFVALTEHAKGKLWTGDKILAKGLERKGWNKVITTPVLYQALISSNR